MFLLAYCIMRRAVAFLFKPFKKKKTTFNSVFLYWLARLWNEFHPDPSYFRSRAPTGYQQAPHRPASLAACSAAPSCAGPAGGTAGERDPASTRRVRAGSALRS